MLIRLSKISLVASSAFFLLLVVFNNLTDYGSNFEFVRHVLSMDTTFPGNQGMWRALNSPVIHHAFYASIILWEHGHVVVDEHEHITVGGEWFLMWQSSIWNGQTAAARMFTVFALILIFLNQRDHDNV